MNKKHQMVSELIDRIERANVRIPASGHDPSGDGLKLRANSSYWEVFPDGHSRGGYFGDTESVESNLACLSEETLAKILVDDKVEDGMDWNALWRAWGKAKYFEFKPSIVYRSGSDLPKLYMRHDCYLHFFRGQGFQNSMDIVCDGSNGQSSMVLDTYRSIIDLPELSSLYEGLDSDECGAVSNEWYADWNVFRTAMIYSLPFEACHNKRCFYRMLSNDDGVLFDEFMRLTDEHAMHIHLNPDVGYKDIVELAENTATDPTPMLEIPLTVHDRNGEERVIAFLRYGNWCVSLTWSHEAKQHNLALRFPKYDLAAYEAELRGIDLNYDYPDYLSEESYYYHIWTALSTVLLMISPMSFGSFYFGSRKPIIFDSAPVTLYHKESCADGTYCVYSIISDYCKRFRSFEFCRQKFYEEYGIAED